jgi:hypothetical protein
VTKRQCRALGVSTLIIKNELARPSRCGRPDLAQKASTKRNFVGATGPHQFPRHRPHRDRTGQGDDVSEEEMIRRRLADLGRMRRLP